MGKADLHIHTTASDGNSTPSQIVDRAVKQKLAAIAITDHDTIAGFEEAREAGRKQNIEVLPGCEITAEFNSREAHLLAYCFDHEDLNFRKLLSGHKKARISRGEWILGELGKQGLELDMNEVKAEANGSNIGRPHIASVLVSKGYVRSFKEAFIRYLSNQKLGIIPSDYYSCSEVIATVKNAGGAVVVAHPGQMYSEKELNQLVEHGIDGIEVIHPGHNYELQKKMEEFAESNSLLTTGGSDFHGGSRDYQKYFGVATISMTKVRAMKRLIEQRKEILVS